jgi:hypothetical protein
MSPHYIKLFEVHFEHKYFSDGRLNGVKILPSAETQSLFVRYELVLKPQADGFIVFFAETFEGVKRDREVVLNKIIKLQFTFQFADPSFYTYTGNIPDDTVNKIFRFSNFDEKRKIVKKSPLLHVADFVGETEIQQPRSNFNSNGYIDVYLHDQLDEDLFIRFMNRSTYWHYTIVSSYFQGVENMAIIDKTNQKIFSGPESVVLPNGSKGITFSAYDPHPLTERYDNSFRLVAGYDETTRQFERQLVARLPGPALQNITKLKHSDIFI